MHKIELEVKNNAQVIYHPKCEVTPNEHSMYN
jgi:hypothetical protein